MKNFINKKCNIVFESNGKTLYFTADIQNISEDHITFIDKFGKTYAYRLKDVIQIDIIKGGDF